MGWDSCFFSVNYGNTGVKVRAASTQGKGNPFPDTLAHEWLYNPSGIYFDGVKIDESWVYAGIIDDWGVFEEPLSLRFFGTDRLPTLERKSDVEFYYWECIKDGVAKIRLIPCYNKITGVVGMYDVVNKKFYINEGAGAFVKGADI